MNRTKGIIGLAMAVIMISSIFAIMPVSAKGPGPTPVEADNPQGITVPALSSLRVYGECDEGPVAGAGLGSDRSQFVYPNYWDPFDPGALLKDSVTFNPALYLASDYDTSVNGFNSHEKVFLRLWYEPEHEYTKPIYVYPTIEVESTYMFVWAQDCIPIAGAPPNTRFVFPITEKYVSPAPLPPGASKNQTGLAEIENVVITPPYTPDKVVLRSVSGITDRFNKTTKGTIQLDKDYTLHYGEVVQFLDHKLRFEGLVLRDAKTFAKVTLWYAGNLEDDTQVTLLLGQFSDGTPDDPLAVTWFKRHNEPYHKSDHANHVTWYAQFLSGIAGTADIRVGKELQAGDTFYVNAVRYDVPAIEVIDTNGIYDSLNYTYNADAVKYITLRTPLPKAKTSMLVTDDGKASSQWIDTIAPGEQIPLPPPFNKVHRMIRDINVAPADELISPCDRYYSNVPPLAFNYIEEAIDTRFSTDLLQILNETITGTAVPVESWTKYDIQTRPDQYTEFVLPRNETDPAGIYRWYYLLTSSLLAPNSLTTNHNLLDQKTGLPRVAFAYDASVEASAQDISVNRNGADVTIRIYGDDNIGPLGGYNECGGNVYSNYQYPFNPAAIRKDSITFNKAIIEDGTVGDMSANSRDIDVKKYLRMWYEPEHNYSKPVYQYPTIEVESTYLLIDSQDKQPWGAPEKTTHFVFPIVSNYSTLQKGLEDWENEEGTPWRPNVVTLAYVNGTVSPYNKTTEGIIRLEKTYTLTVGETVQFLDHKLRYNGPSIDNRAQVRMWYAGMPGADTQETGALLGTISDVHATTWFDTHNNIRDHAVPSHMETKWYARCELIDADNDNAAITVGMELQPTDIFYVDGVRYDVSAIEVYDSTPDTWADKFKYITLRTPLPKGDGSDVPDDGCVHEGTQRIWTYPSNTVLPLNPPFNMEHYIVDDIDVTLWKPRAHVDKWPIGDLNGVPGTTFFPCGERYVTMQHPETATLCGDGDGSAWKSYFDAVQVNTNPTDPNDRGWIAYDVKERIIPRPYPPLEVKWVSETTEPRYTTNLLEIQDEILNISAAPIEGWRKFEIATRPDHYTEFLVPADTSRYNFTAPKWAPKWDELLHNDYLVTTSFLAPNAVTSTLDDLMYTGFKRAAFVYDAIDIKGLYVNEIAESPPGPENNAPNVSAVIDDATVEGCEEIEVCTNGTNDEYYPLDVWVDWGDGETSLVRQMQNAGDIQCWTHSYIDEGLYTVKVYAKDPYGLSAFNDTIQVTVNSTCAVYTFNVKGFYAISTPVQTWLTFDDIFPWAGTTVQEWDPTVGIMGNWKSVPLTTVPDPAKGYFVYKNFDGPDQTITIIGAATTVTPAPIVGRWNLIGVGDTPTTVSFWCHYWNTLYGYEPPTTHLVPTRAYFTTGLP